MSELKRIFAAKASSAEDIAARLLARADAGKSHFNPDQMFLLIGAAFLRSRNISQEDRDALFAINNGEARSVRMLNLLARHEGVDMYFTDEAMNQRAVNKGIMHMAPPQLQ
jgi:hypothetical protein